MANLDDLLKISLIVLVFAITIAIVIQLGMILFSINSILRDFKKASNAMVKKPHEARMFAIESVGLLLEHLIFKEINKAKSGALGGFLKALKFFSKKASLFNS